MATKPNPLPEEVIARIRAEEELRFTIRQELELAGKAEHPKSKTWQFLNSAFGLFLLTSMSITREDSARVSQRNTFPCDRYRPTDPLLAFLKGL